MEKCKLCKITEADKKGSHIIPHFLLKKVDSKEDLKERDKAIGFRIGSTETTSYFGRSVLPDKLNEVFGAISEEDLNKNENPFIVDNYFCTNCEDRFAQIENEYAKTINKFKVGEYENPITPEITTLFWISIIWRVSQDKKNGFILKPKEEELLRRILNQYLKIKLSDIDFSAIRKDMDCNQLSYSLLRCPNYSKENATFVFFHPFHKMPYSLIIDEFVLFFYFKKGHRNSIRQSFFGLEQNLEKCQLNSVNTSEKIYPIQFEHFKKCMEKVLHLLTDKRLEFYNNLFDEAHKALGGKGNEMPIELKRNILNRIITGEKEIGDSRSNYQSLSKTQMHGSSGHR